MSNVSRLCELIFLNSLDPAKKVKSEQIHHMLCSRNLCISLKKKKRTLSSFVCIQTQKFCLYFIFKYNYFYCGLKFMLVDVGINSEHTGINNIMFNYSFHRTLATEYEELKTKMQPL